MADDLGDFPSSPARARAKYCCPGKLRRKCACHICIFTPGGKFFPRFISTWSKYFSRRERERNRETTKKGVYPEEREKQTQLNQNPVQLDSTGE